MRIVSLCPSLTELVFDLGRGEDLVGVTKWCVRPAPEVLNIEKVGGTKDPDLDRICGLKPDLVLLNEEENRLEDAEALRGAGIEMHTSLPKTPADAARMCNSIATVLGREQAGKSIAQAIEKQCAEAEAWARGRSAQTWAYLIWRKPYMSVNADTYVNSLFELAGGRNVFAHRAERYPEVSVEELVQAAPEHVFLCTEPFVFRERHIRELAQLTGLDPQRIQIVDGELLSWCGSRTRFGVPYAAQLLGRPSDA